MVNYKIVQGFGEQYNNNRNIINFNLQTIIPQHMYTVRCTHILCLGRIQKELLRNNSVD